MNPSLEELDARLAAARKAQDDDEIAAALVNRANWLVQRGRMDEARDGLDEAAFIHGQHGRGSDEARCTHLAATVSRFAGDLEGAEERAEKAESIAEDGTPQSVAAATELGEIAITRKQGRIAIQHIERALEHGAKAGLVPVARAALLRRQAQAFAMARQPAEAALYLRRARQLFEQAGDRISAVRAWAEETTAWTEANRTPEAHASLEGALVAATALDDDHALADLEMLRATHLLRAEDADGALAATRAAQAHSLKEVNAFAYTSATIAISMLCDRTGDRVGAYEALAVGWVTLGDLMGKELGQATFGPKLKELAEQWGREEFERVRDTYYARLQAETSD